MSWDGDAGVLLCIHSGATSGIKKAVANQDYFCHFAVEKSCCLCCFNVCANVHTWAFSAEGNLFLI